MLFFAVAVRKRNRGRVVVILFAFQRVGGVGIDHITDHLGNIDLIVFAGVALREYKFLFVRVVGATGRVRVGIFRRYRDFLLFAGVVFQADGRGIVSGIFRPCHRVGRVGVDRILNRLEVHAAGDFIARCIFNGKVQRVTFEG